VSELSLTLGWIAEAVAGELRGGNRDTEVKEVLTDSRNVSADDLFVALRGPRFDAHEFVGDVLNRGAAAAIVGRDWTERADRADLKVRPSVIVVDDTLSALQALAHAVRMAVTTQVIAITGSAGKTTTKETIAAFLSGRFRVVKNKGNLNNHIGLPLSLMQLRTRPDVAVMELGMNHAGEIRTLVDIAEPEVRVWTNVGDAHLGFFASADAIADAKAEILEKSGRDTVLVCNADDPRVASRLADFPGRALTFGTDQRATVRAVEIEDRGLHGMRARVITSAGEAALETPLLGRGNLFNLLAGTAVALHFGVPLDEVASIASRLTPADRRGAVRLLRGITVIDDSYNSSPAALRRALEVVAADKDADRKVAVLGEMLELGDHAIRLHRECGRAAAETGLSLLFAVGGAPARALADAAIESGLSRDAVQYFETSNQAADAVVSALREGDLVLVKGSRGIRTDVIADRLGAEFA
jgi:UDP-N-acetylmuramoyl-tripeptide--D-alanyl-D-alanine ligase